jgi:hypothetical protein
MISAAAPRARPPKPEDCIVCEILLVKRLHELVTVYPVRSAEKRCLTS